MIQRAGALLRFDELRGGYGDTAVLRGISGAVAAGEVLGVLGRNGVGKTTLMRLLTGYIAPFAGQVRWRGDDIAALTPYRRQRAGISYAPQEGVVFDGLSVRDNLSLHRRRRDLDDYAPLFDHFPRVRERLAQPAGSLSGGEKKLVSFTRVMAERAPLTLLDEPSEGVQQEHIDRMAALIRAAPRRRRRVHRRRAEPELPARGDAVGAGARPWRDRARRRDRRCRPRAARRPPAGLSPRHRRPSVGGLSISGSAAQRVNGSAARRLSG